MALSSTQGQLDWVALSKLGMNCTLDVASRIMRGGVDACTLLVGRGVCTSFAFPAAGQKMLQDSLARVKGVSSFQKVLWFGFGLKNIIHMLSETEDGALCVSLSAALALPYADSYDAARVWHHYCLLKGAPVDFRPSIHQWKCLVDSCAGALNMSNFMHHYDHFSRTLAPGQNNRLPAPAAEVALGLATLADLSLDKISSAVFVGNIECAWLAAVARCLLCLSIQLQDENGNILYTGADSLDEPVRATFRPSTTKDNSAKILSAALVERICFISSGRELLHERLDFQTVAVRNQSQWKTIFSDAFPDWSSFMEGTTAKCFGSLLQQVAFFSEQYYIDASGIGGEAQKVPWWLAWGSDRRCLFHPRRTGLALLKFAYSTFPELSHLSVDQCVLGCRHRCNVNVEMEQTLNRISACCRCFRCQKTTPDGLSNTYSTCSRRLAQALIRIILMLAPVNIQDMITPSVTACRQIYNCTTPTCMTMRGQDAPTTDIELILYLFTGRYSTRASAAQSISTVCASGGGICVFYSILTNPEQPLADFMGIDILPGHVKYQERRYSTIADSEIHEHEPEAIKQALLNGLSLGELNEDRLTVNLVAEETRDRDTLSVCYRAVLDRHAAIDIRIAELEQRLRRNFTSHHCQPSGCSDTFSIDGRMCSWSPAADQLPVRGTIAGFHELLTPSLQSWLLLDWTSWKWRDRSGVPAMDHLDLNVYCGNNIILFLLLVTLLKDPANAVEMEHIGASVLLSKPTSMNCIVYGVIARLVSTLPADEDETLKVNVRSTVLAPRYEYLELALGVSIQVSHSPPRSQQGLWTLFGRRAS